MTAMGLGGRIQREGGETLAPIRATVNRTERGQRLRALNWMKQVRIFQTFLVVKIRHGPN